MRLSISCKWGHNYSPWTYEATDQQASMASYALFSVLEVAFHLPRKSQYPMNREHLDEFHLIPRILLPHWMIQYSHFDVQ